MLSQTLTAIAISIIGLFFLCPTLQPNQFTTKRSTQTEFGWGDTSNNYQTSQFAMCHMRVGFPSYNVVNASKIILNITIFFPFNNSVILSWVVGAIAHFAPLQIRHCPGWVSKLNVINCLSTRARARRTMVWRTGRAWSKVLLGRNWHPNYTLILCNTTAP